MLDCSKYEYYRQVPSLASLTTLLSYGHYIHFEPACPKYLSYPSDNKATPLAHTDHVTTHNFSDWMIISLKVNYNVCLR